MSPLPAPEILAIHASTKDFDSLFQQFFPFRYLTIHIFYYLVILMTKNTFFRELARWDCFAQAFHGLTAQTESKPGPLVLRAVEVVNGVLECRNFLHKMY